VIVAQPVRPVAFVAVAVAMTVAVPGSGWVLLPGLARRAVVVVSGRRAAVAVVVAMRQARRHVVPVSDRTAVRRTVLLAGLAGREVMPVAERETV
jgi:hypothetical protein